MTGPAGAGPGATDPAVAGSDPRDRGDGLGWVTRAVFPDRRLRLALGAAGDRGAVPRPGYRVTARYAVVPSLARARFLLPLGRRRVTAASVWAYNALRPLPVRLPRAVLGLAARFGALELARPPVLSVSVPVEGVPPGELMLVDHLADRLGGRRWYAAIGVRPPDPNHKPTVQLFDAGGQPRGYAKIGWNDATRELVRAEAAALADPPPAGPAPGGHPVVPGVLLAGDWAGQAVTVVEPLPPRVRGLGTGVAAPETVLAVARRGGPPATPCPLHGSRFLDRLHRLAAESAAGTAGPAGTAGTAGGRALAAVRHLADRFGTVTLEFGHWHGDWVPWNLGRHAGQLVAWDWEHSGPDVPVGFDLAHDAFQRAVVLRSEPVAAAAVEADGQLRRHAGLLGLDAERRFVVVQSYLIEMWLRTWRLAAGGAGWNPELHPALLDVVEQRRVG
ncbi:hypothetical protein ACN27F_10940 [Solwaraspora sp. WMMB335]|uniref:hypothetical protein n=1 Tax=Solwaraspora sp. WMMB335 TaxID=3404118 RepID=UPI003B95E147